MHYVICAAFGFAGGLTLSIGFILGFKAKEKHDDTGKFVGKVEVVDPIQVTDRMVRELEERERNQDALWQEE